MLRMLPLAGGAGWQPSRWLSRFSPWRSGLRWWRERNRGRRAVAQVDDDQLSDLSELGRQVRREERASVVRRSSARASSTDQVAATQVHFSPRLCLHVLALFCKVSCGRGSPNWIARRSEGVCVFRAKAWPFDKRAASASPDLNPQVAVIAERRNPKLHFAKRIR